MGFLYDDFLDSVKRLDNINWPRVTSSFMSNVMSGAERKVEDDEQRIYVRAPGYTRDDLNVEVRNGYLRVYGSIPEDKRVSRLIDAEIDYQFTVGGGWQIEEATHRDGLLCIRLTRLTQTEGTKIPIS